MTYPTRAIMPIMLEDYLKVGCSHSHRWSHNTARAAYKYSCLALPVLCCVQDPSHRQRLTCLPFCLAMCVHVGSCAKWAEGRNLTCVRACMHAPISSQMPAYGTPLPPPPPTPLSGHDRPPG